MTKRNEFDHIAFLREDIIPALRSGEYLQGRRALRRLGPLRPTERPTWCCLGVMVDRLHKAGILDGEWWGGDYRYPEISRMSESSFLSFDTAELLGFGWRTQGPMVDIDGVWDDLAAHNDRGVPFDKIADALERCIEGQEQKEAVEFYDK